MIAKRSFMVNTGIRILLASGLFMLVMLLAAFSISCQTTLPAEKEVAPPKEEALPPEEIVVGKKPIVPEEPVSTPEPELSPTPEPGLMPASEPELMPTSTEVKISGFAFVPAVITVPAGTTVTWTNNDSPPHTASSNDALFDSGSLSRGETFSYTFEQDGTFEYHCKIHPTMKGVVIVGKETVSIEGETTSQEKAPPYDSGDDY